MQDVYERGVNHAVSVEEGGDGCRRGGCVGGGEKAEEYSSWASIMTRAESEGEAVEGGTPRSWRKDLQRACCWWGWSVISKSEGMGKSDSQRLLSGG